MLRIEEAGINFFVYEGVFYNPHMKLSRDISSLVVGELGKLKVLDAFSATGIRGIRYYKENSNINSIDFLDINKRSIKNINKNTIFNEVEGNIIHNEFNRYIANTEKQYNFIELDPFGSPVPYMYNAMRHICNLKEGFISVTATDLQVLCGIQKEACMKFYQSNSKNNYFCHETGLRILIKKMAEIATELNLVLNPITSFYYRHQMKVIAKLKRDGKNAYKNIEENTGYIEYNKNDMKFKVKKFFCGKEEIGKLWIGQLHDEDILKRVIDNNKKKTQQVEKMFNTFAHENDFPPYHYSTHIIAKRFKLRIPKIGDLSKEFEKNGARFSPTHFSPVSFKTQEKIENIIKIIKKMNEKRGKNYD